MEAVRILKNPATITWEYDEEADVLYLSWRTSPGCGSGHRRGGYFTLRRSPQRSRGAYIDRAEGTLTDGSDRHPLNPPEEANAAAQAEIIDLT